jgi:hypothetical protein
MQSPAAQNAGSHPHLYNYYSNLNPPPHTGSEWWLKLWPTSISISSPTAADGVKALQNPSVLKGPIKMILLIAQDPTDSHWYNAHVLYSIMPSAQGTSIKVSFRDIKDYEAFFPTFQGPPDPTSLSIDGPDIWMMP